jgi:DNA-directed RNA polymerase specialized sigma24 family protein
VWPETPLSEVLKLRGPDPAAASRALVRLLDVYRRPIHTYIERRTPPGLRHHVDDWTQEFILKFVEGTLTAHWEPGHGHLRSYVARSLGNFVVDQLRSLGRQPDACGTEGDLDEYPAASDEAFHREWAILVVTRALERLRQASGSTPDGQRRLEILRLRYGIDEPRGAHSYEMISARLGVPLARHHIDNVLRSARKDLVEAVREEVRLLMYSDEGIDPELWRLSELVGGG